MFGGYWYTGQFSHTIPHIATTSYLGEFPSVSLGFYFKSIVFIYRIKALWADSPVLPSCGTIWCSYGLGACRRNKSYHGKFSSISFCFYLEKTLFMCRISPQLDETSAFLQCGMIRSFYGEGVMCWHNAWPIYPQWGQVIHQPLLHLKATLMKP